MSKKANLAVVAGTTALALVPGEVAKDAVENAPAQDTPWTEKTFKLAEHKKGETVIKPATGTMSMTTDTNKVLYAKVTTTDISKQKSVIIGARIVDMYHFGTRAWLLKHMWWAMHNGHLVETELATDAEVSEYLADATQKLAEKFNGKVA